MIHLEALDWLRAVTMDTPRAQVYEFLSWILHSDWGPMQLTDEDDILQRALAIQRFYFLEKEAPIKLDRTIEPGGLLTRWTAIGSNDGWPKEAMNNCQALRIIIAACRAAEVRTCAYEVWLHCLTSENAEAFSWESAQKLQEILDGRT